MAAYQLNQSNVVADTIDGEVLAIRSDTGSYYSLVGPAASIWSGLVAGVDTELLAPLVAAHHGVASVPAGADVQEAIDRFAAVLAAEALLLAVDEPPADATVELPPETAGTPWAEPEFEKYTDMQDLLLFDPIHEVAPAGWPAVVPPPT